MKLNRVSIFVLVLMGSALVGARAWGQDPMLSPPPVHPVDVPPATNAVTPAPDPQQAAPAATQEPAAVQPPKTAQAPKAPPVKKGGKVPYTGPTEVIVLEPTPMLDGEGKQRIDPDGKPMFNPPVKQQRDKQGHPLFEPDGKPVFQTATNLGYDDKGHKIAVKKEKPPKTISVSIAKGTLTVDGMIGKAALNYDINDFKYVYLYAPWIGTAVVSNAPFPGSKEQKNAFNLNTLTVTVEDHTFQVFSEKPLLGKKPESAFVAVDRDFKLPTQAPVMGYGATVKAPYLWPGAKANPESKAYVKPPPVPVNLRPTQLLPPCPKGEMRQGAKVVLPGEVAPEAPCVPIVTGSAKPAPAPVAPAPVPPSPQ